MVNGRRDTSDIIMPGDADELRAISRLRRELSPNFGDGRAGQAAAVLG